MSSRSSETLPSEVSNTKSAEEPHIVKNFLYICIVKQKDRMGLRSSFNPESNRLLL